MLLKYTWCCSRSSWSTSLAVRAESSVIPVLQTPVSVVGDRWIFFAVAMGAIFQTMLDDELLVGTAVACRLTSPGPGAGLIALDLADLDIGANRGKDGVGSLLVASEDRRRIRLYRSIQISRYINTAKHST